MPRYATLDELLETEEKEAPRQATLEELQPRRATLAELRLTKAPEKPNFWDHVKQTAEPIKLFGSSNSEDDIAPTRPEVTPDNTFQDKNIEPSPSPAPSPQEDADVDFPSVGTVLKDFLVQRGSAEALTLNPAAEERIEGSLRIAGQGLTQLPKAIGAAVLKGWQGSEGASVVDKGWMQKTLQDAEMDSDEFVKDIYEKYGDKQVIRGIPIKMTDIAELPRNIAFSVASMGAGLAVGVPMAFMPVPGARVAAWTLGTVGSGLVAYDMASYEIMQEYLEAKNEESFEDKGRGITAEEEKELKQIFGYNAMKYGLWEAIPEAISNLAFTKLLTAPLSKMVGKTIAGRIVAKLSGIYGEELITETITQVGQAGIEKEVGLREDDISVIQAFKEVAPQTFLLTTVMAGAGSSIIAIGNKAKQALKKETAKKELSPEEEAGLEKGLEEHLNNIEQEIESKAPIPAADIPTEVGEQPKETKEFLEEKVKQTRRKKTEQKLVEQGRWRSMVRKRRIAPPLNKSNWAKEDWKKGTKSLVSDGLAFDIFFKEAKGIYGGAIPAETADDMFRLLINQEAWSQQEVADTDAEMQEQAETAKEENLELFNESLYKDEEKVKQEKWDEETDIEQEIEQLNEEDSVDEEAEGVEEVKEEVKEKPEKVEPEPSERGIYKSDPYKQGKLLAEKHDSDTTKTENPYSSDTWQFKAWNQGWNDAEPIELKITEKQPWEMTQDEYAEERVKLGFSGEGARAGHKADIQQALQEGKPVPPEVLKDYPELKPEVKGEALEEEAKKEGIDLKQLGKDLGDALPGVGLSIEDVSRTQKRKEAQKRILEQYLPALISEAKRIGMDLKAYLKEFTDYTEDERDYLVKLSQRDPLEDKPLPQEDEGEGKRKVHGLSKKVMKQAIEEGMAEELGDLPTYRTRNIEKAIERASEFIFRKPDLALKIALGEAPEQGNIRASELYSALRIKAFAERDVAMIQQLAYSKTAISIATELGQRVKAYDIGVTFDPIKTVQSVEKEREDFTKKMSEEKREKETKILQEKLDTAEKKLQDVESKLEEAKKETKKKKPRSFGSGNKIFTQKLADEAREALKKKLGGLHSGVDPTAVVELTQIGGFYFEGGIREFGAWSEMLVKEFGDVIKPHLKDIWKNVKKEYAKDAVEHSKEALGKMAEEEIPIDKLHFFVQRLALNLIDSGMVGSREDLVKEVQVILQDSYPDITYRETADLVSGYGKYKRLSQDQTKRILRDIKGQLQQISKIEDMQEGQAPLRTGVERRTPSAEERRLIRLVNEAKRKYNIKTTDPRTQLKSALDSVKTRLKNEILRLEERLETMDFEVKKKREIVLDVEAQRLKRRRDRIKRSFKAIKHIETELSKDEVTNIVNLGADASEAQKKVEDKGDWTADNAQDVEDYFRKRNEFEKYVESLKPKGTTDIVNNFIDYFRASILASPRILRNSFLYQIVPGIERSITKRLVTGAFSDADLKSNIVEKFLAKLSGIKPSKKSADFVKRQVAMATRIYHETGIDISRQEKLDSPLKIYGEKVGKISGKSIFAKIGRTVNLAPKWLAGGTDMLFANIGRADTAIMMSKEIAKIESLQGKLPEGMTQEQRADQLLKESYSFNPKDKRAGIIREAGIRDAHMMNNTQPGWWSDKVIEFRRMMKIGKVDFGKAIIPFAKIANVVVAEGFKTASGYGIAKSLYDINQASRKSNITDRAKLMRSAVTDLVRYVGLAGAVLLLTAFLDDDDYIGAYSNLSWKEYQLARARGARTGSIRIGGKWMTLRYLPMLNIGISALMEARQAKAKGVNPFLGYYKGMVGQILEAPGVKEIGKQFVNLQRSAKAKDVDKLVESLDLDSKGISDWAKVRMIPSVLSYDVYNALFPKDNKYDFMGREIEKGAFKDDKSNDITLEYNRLANKDFFPVISDPTGKYAVVLEEDLGEEKYQEMLSGFKRKYAEKVSEEINSSWYRSLSDEKKKKRVDDIRDREILDKLRHEELIRSYQ